MLRLTFRLIGFLCLALAFAAMIVDGTRSIAAGAPAIMPLGNTAATLFPAPFMRFRAGIEAAFPPLWDPALVTVLLLPTWLVIGVLGLLLIALTRPAREKVGYSRR